MKLNIRISGLILIAACTLTACAPTTNHNAMDTIPSLDTSQVVSLATDNIDKIALDEKIALRIDANEKKQKTIQEEKERLEEAARIESARVEAESKTQIASVDVPEPKVESPVESAPLAKTSSATSLLPGESAYQWMDRMQKLYGVYAYPGTQFYVAPGTPCDHFAPQALGCTEQILDSVTHQPWHQGIKLHMAERAIGNLYVLFHEIAHTQGIMDECQADIYSRNVTGIPGGYYCQ